MKYIALIPVLFLLSCSSPVVVDKSSFSAGQTTLEVNAVEFDKQLSLPPFTTKHIKIRLEEFWGCQGTDAVTKKIGSGRLTTKDHIQKVTIPANKELVLALEYVDISSSGSARCETMVKFVAAEGMDYVYLFNTGPYPPKCSGQILEVHGDELVPAPLAVYPATKRKNFLMDPEFYLCPSGSNES